MVHESILNIAIRDPKHMEEIYALNMSITLGEGKLNHLFHCIGYLRQSIMCNADTTLEWKADWSEVHIDGYGIPRQCRNLVSWKANMPTLVRGN